MLCVLLVLVLLSIPSNISCDHVEDTDQKSLQIIDVNDYDTFLLNEETLREILLDDEIKDRYVCVVSIAGGFREGKSFVLNFILRYLHVKYTLKQPTDDWLNSKYGTVRGFSWKGGSKTDTVGIVMWSKIFLTELNSGEKVAIILLDTQGAFDNTKTHRESATIFALSTLISSVQIYNIMRNVEEEQIKNLEFFAEYGRHFMSNSKPFQNLVFLVRDWAFAHEKPYGMHGGKMLLNEIFNEGHENESLHRVFDDISCFLMPHPGKTVAESKDFVGDMKDVDIFFKEYARVLAAFLLNEENLVLKRINGEVIRAKELVFYLEEYMHIFKTSSIPKTESVIMATIEANYKTVLDDSLEIYKKIMSERDYFDEDLHVKAKNESETYFSSRKRLENTKICTNYRQKLDKRISELSKQLKDYYSRGEEKSELLLDFIVADALKLFEASLDDLGAVSETDFRNYYLEARSQALVNFDRKIPSGSPPFVVSKKRKELVNVLDVSFYKFRDRNFMNCVKFWVTFALAILVGILSILCFFKSKTSTEKKGKKN